MEKDLKTNFRKFSDNVIAGIEEAVIASESDKRNVLFSYTFRIDALDLLPIITHPSDRQHLRFYW